MDAILLFFTMMVVLGVLNTIVVLKPIYLTNINKFQEIKLLMFVHKHAIIKINIIICIKPYMIIVKYVHNVYMIENQYFYQITQFKTNYVSMNVIQRISEFMMVCA